MIGGTDSECPATTIHSMRGPCHLGAPRAHAGGQFLDEAPHQQGDVFLPLTQRRDADRRCVSVSPSPAGIGHCHSDAMPIPRASQICRKASVIGASNSSVGRLINLEEHSRSNVSNRIHPPESREARWKTG